MKPNWSAAPEWAQYASQEQSGSWYWHETQPRFQEMTGEWISKGRREILPKVDTPAKESIECRPASFSYSKYLETFRAQQE